MRLLSSRSLLAIAITIFSFGNELFAASVTLQQALQEAGDRSPNLQKSRSALEEASWKKVESYNGFLPTLTGGVSYITNKKYLLTDIQFGPATISVPQVIPTTTYTLNANLPLFDGFTNTSRYHAATSNEDSARSELDWTQFSTERQVILQFYKTLAARQLKDVSQQNLKTLQDHMRDVQALKAAGLSTKYEVLRVEVQLSEARSEILNTEDNYEVSKLKLGEVIGNQDEVREPEGVLPVLKSEAIQSTKGLALDKRRDIAALEKKGESSDYQSTAASRYWVPRISLFGQYQYYNNINDKFAEFDTFRDSYLVGLNFTWNIFDGLTSPARAHEAAEQAVQLQKSIEQTKLHAHADYTFWKRKYLYFCEVYRARTADIERSNEAIRLAREGRRAGTRTNSELLDAELDLFRTRAGLINAQIGAVEALISLELASGEQLYHFN